MNEHQNEREPKVSSESKGRVTRTKARRVVNERERHRGREHTVAIIIPMNFAVFRSTNPSEARSSSPEVATHAPLEMDSPSQLNCKEARKRRGDQHSRRVGFERWRWEGREARKGRGRGREEGAKGSRRETYYESSTFVDELDFGGWFDGSYPGNTG